MINNLSIKLDTNPDKFFRQLVELLANFQPVKGLRNKEREVLAEIMKQNYLNKDLKEHIRRNYIFSPETKRKISSNVGISRDALNTNISMLKKKGVMNDDKTLIKPLQIYPKRSFTFTLTFKIKR